MTETKPTTPLTGLAFDDVAEDDPDVILVAHAIAEHGIGRPWDDFLPVNAYDVDHGDLIEYGRAAVAALRAAEPPLRCTVCGFVLDLRFAAEFPATESRKNSQTRAEPPSKTLENWHNIGRE